MKLKTAKFCFFHLWGRFSQEAGIPSLVAMNNEAAGDRSWRDAKAQRACWQGMVCFRGGIHGSFARGRRKWP